MKINSSGKSRLAGWRESGKAQSAMEYLATYGWALLVVGAVASIIYFFASTPQILVPASCSFNTGAYCQDLVIGSNVIGSNSMSSGAWFFFTNSQPYAIVNPQLLVNVSGSSSVMAGTCLPANVLPGGAILCNTVLSQNFASGVLVSGKLYFSAIPCQSGNAVSCGSTGLRQSYLGSFNAQARRQYGERGLQYPSCCGQRIPGREWRRRSAYRYRHALPFQCAYNRCDRHLLLECPVRYDKPGRLHSG